MGSKCKTCGLTERSHHPCNEAGTLYPCPDEFHREMSIVQCQQPGCTANGLTRARGWWCAIHHPEHPMGPVAPTPPAPAVRHWQHDETGRVCDCVDCPGPRYHEVNEAFAEAHEKAMRERCGTPAPADDAGGGRRVVYFDWQQEMWFDKDGDPGERTKFIAIPASAVSADDASGAEAMGVPGLDFQPPRDRTPKGYTRVEAYMGQGHVVVMGYPTDESHSCDALGCGSTGAHVIARLPLPATDDAVEEAARALAWVEREIATLTERMEPIGPDRVGYKDRDRYDFWCWIKNHRDRLKTVRGHLLAIQRQRAEADFLRADEKYAALRRAKESRSDDSRPASGQGGA